MYVQFLHAQLQYQRAWSPVPRNEWLRHPFVVVIGGTGAANVGYDVGALYTAYNSNFHYTAFVIVAYWFLASTYFDEHGLCIPCRFTCLVLLRITLELFINIGGPTHEQYNTSSVDYCVYYVGVHSFGKELDIGQLRSKCTGRAGDCVQDDFILIAGSSSISPLEKKGNATMITATLYHEFACSCN